MYRKTLLLLLIVVQAGSLLAQQKKKGYKWEWQVGTAIGTNLPITKLLKGRPTDFLVDYNDKGIQYQYYSVGVFFHPRWGIDFSFGGGHTPTIDRQEQFNAAMQSTYSDRYYIDPGPVAGFNSFNNVGIIRAMIGITYRWQKNNWLFYPKLSLGSTVFGLKDQISYLKEKEGNHYQELVFRSPGYKDPEPFTVGLSAVAGYRITRWLMVNAELRSTYLRPNFGIEKMVLDLETRALLSSETIRYKASVLTLTPQIGLVLCFKPSPNPSPKSHQQKTKKRKRNGLLPIL